jgi:menaquinol-cytochrome c reductase cytochrome b/c subunit
MTEIPESLLRRSAEAKAKALGLPVEQVLAEMKGEAPPPAPEEPPAEVEAEAEVAAEAEVEPSVDEVPPADTAVVEEPEVEVTSEPEVSAEAPHEAPADASEPPAPEPDPVAETPSEPAPGPDPVAETPSEPVPEPDPVVETPAEPVPAAPDVAAAETESEEAAAAVATMVEEPPPAAEGNGSGNGAGNGKVAALVSPRPAVPPTGTPEGVRTQRLLTVVKARAIQTVKAEPTDKVNTWPHLMLMEFGALLAITGFLVILAVIIHSPLLDPANFNSTPNPSKAPWYFLGLQELLSYFDPQIAGVTVPTITGMIGFMAVPYVDKNPSTRPSDRKFAIALYSVFLAGAATLTIIGVLFRGQGFNFSYPWKDGVFFDDLKDWVQFE